MFHRFSRSAILRRAVATTTLAGALSLLPHTAAAQTVPTGATPVSGGVSVSGTTGNAGGGLDLTVTQSGTRGVVNWTSFSVGANDRVTFNQPDASAATLNRVTGGAGSTIAGSVVSNGAVYLVNPNGIAITATGQVQTGGGFVASTLDIADSDFAAGRLNFTGGGASARVVNGGSIVAGMGSYVALLGGSVSNGGTITVPLGKVALGSGERIALDLNGDGFLQVAMPSAAAGGQLIKSGGSIVAAGGRIELKVASVAQAVRDVINVSGSISADSATGNGGGIVLLGGDGGTTRVGGTLTARATGATGNGGFVETSGAAIDYAGLKVDTSAAHGTTGTWLIDPVNLTVDAAAAATISTNLATSNVALTTNTNNATGPGIQSAGPGDIIVNSAITWTSINTLRLDAYNDIALNAAITGTAGGLTLTAGANVANTGAVSATGAVNVGVFNLINGRWSQVAATLPAFAARDFRFLTTKASFLRATGGTGVTGSTYAIGDVYGLQGMASPVYLGNSFVLTGDIAAIGTANWNSGAGFVPIGTTTAFSGNFDGANHVISGLLINSPNNSGLFGISIGAIANVGLVGGGVANGGNVVGSLVGRMNGGSLSNAYATTPVNSPGSIVGGLVGHMAAGSITNSYATGAVAGGNARIGGLIGQMTGGTIGNVYATGTASGSTLIGGLIGYMADGTVTRAYATGAVASTDTNESLVGGLIGERDAGSVDAVYASGRVTGTGAYVGGLIGYNIGLVGSGYWDTYSTGQLPAYGLNEDADARAVTSDPAQATAANYAYKAGAYIGLPAATGLGTAGATGFVFMPGDTTRPFLAFEVPLAGNPGVATNAANQIVLTNSHQLQLVGYNGATLSAGYALGNAVDLAETGRVVVGTPGSYSGMWAGTGFVAVGTAGSGIDNNAVVWNGSAFVAGGGTGFTGSLNGGGFTAQNLTIRRPTATYGALIGFASGGGTVSNIGVTNVAINAASFSGALIGRTTNSTVSNAYSTGIVTATNGSGGLVGFLQGGTIAGSYSAVNISGTASIGGLVGSDYGATSNAYATGTVTGTGQYVGGLVGDSNGGGVFTNVYATGNVTSTAGYVGGLVGWLNGGSLTSGRAAGSVTVNAPASVSFVGGLVGNAAGTIASSTASGSVTATNTSYVGGLVGIANTSVMGSSASGNVSGSGTYVGGLIGYAQTTVSSSSASGNVGGSSYVGGLIGRSAGNSSSPVLGSSASGTVTASGNYAGGLIGYSSAAVSTSFASGAVTGLNYVGGLIGDTTATASISQTYASGAVTSTLTGAGAAYAGGLIGYNEGSITVSRSYATGSVGANSTGAQLGGLIGYSLATITQSYATGAIGTTAQYRGGLIGNLIVGSVAASDFWDSYSTGAALAVGSPGVPSTAVAVTSDPTLSGAANYAYKTSAYTGTGGLSAGSWVFFDGQTRPFGVWEPVTPGGALTNSHQLQLIGRGNAAAQAGSYTLGRNIDLAETGRVVAGTPGSYSGMWAGTGFVPLGSDGTGSLWNGSAFVAVPYSAIGSAGAPTGFRGVLNGGGFTLSNLSIVRPGTLNVGLFGGASGTISNLTVSGTVTGYIYVGGLVGALQGGSVSGVTSNVVVRSDKGAQSINSSYAGGLIGFASASSISGSTATGTVASSGAAGGLIGYIFSGTTVTNATASGAVTGRGGKTGGLIGVINGSMVTGGSSTGTVNGVTFGPQYGLLVDGSYNGDTGVGSF